MCPIQSLESFRSPLVSLGMRHRMHYPNQPHPRRLFLDFCRVDQQLEALFQLLEDARPSVLTLQGATAQRFQLEEDRQTATTRRLGYSLSRTFGVS